MKSQLVAAARKKPGGSTKDDKNSVVEKEYDPLTHALWTKMSTNRQTTKDLAAALGITYPYLMALMRQERKFEDSGRKVLERSAKYLDVPIAHAYLLSGALQPGDFFFEDKVPAEIESIYKSLSTHKMWSGFTPSRKEWDALGEKTKLLICLLFQETGHRTVLSTMSVEIPAKEEATKKPSRSKKKGNKEA